MKHGRQSLNLDKISQYEPATSAQNLSINKD